MKCVPLLVNFNLKEIIASRLSAPFNTQKNRRQFPISIMARRTVADWRLISEVFRWFYVLSYGYWVGFSLLPLLFSHHHHKHHKTVAVCYQTTFLPLILSLTTTHPVPVSHRVQRLLLLVRTHNIVFPAASTSSS